MNEIKVFQNEDFGEIRTVVKDGEPWFVGKDITYVLGYANSSKALIDHVDAEDKLNNESLSSLGQRGGWLINESGLYSLILSSKLPTAKKFKRWVTSEVLPSIRKDGVYITDEKAYDITHHPESLADLLVKAGEQLKEKEVVIQEMRPKALFADAVTESDDCILIGELAKIIKQNGFPIGQNKLFQWMRTNGYLIRDRKRSDYNMPTQRAMELKLFIVKERTLTNSDGSVRITKTVKVTGKGQVYFTNKFLK